jgi:hypothetical protein
MICVRSSQLEAGTVFIIPRKGSIGLLQSLKLGRCGSLRFSSSTKDIPRNALILIARGKQNIAPLN